MSYRLNYTDSTNKPEGIVVEDQSLNNTDTSLVFVGKNYPGYSQFIGENFLHLLENFAKSTPPINPIVGQLWYDKGDNTSIASSRPPQLKIYDGTNWTEAGNIKKSKLKPTVENSVVGDLWVDSSSQQLYLFSGTNWILVGPQFSEQNLSGFKVEEIYDRNDVLRIIISILIEEERIAVISKNEFIPKTIIFGFPVIKAGITLTTVVDKKYWGVSEKAESLIIGNTVVPASNFLRSDTASTTNFSFNVRNSSGINFGESLETSFISNNLGTFIRQKTDRPIIFQITNSSVLNDVLKITKDNRVGINVDPKEALDVNGNILTNGIIKTTNLSSNSIDTLGGAQIRGNIIASGNENSFLGEIEVGSDNVAKSILYPKVNNRLDLGKNERRFRTIYAERIEADSIGKPESPITVVGNIIGSASNASKLTTSRSFSITGEITSTTSQFFNGESDVVLTAAINEKIITDRQETFISTVNDYILIYNQNTSLRKLRKSTFLSGFGFTPIGSIMQYAGLVAPPDWLLCDGSEVSITQYQKLFNVIGNTYKPVSLLNGLNTFGLPDFRGRIPLGIENMDNNRLMSVDITATNVTRLPVPVGSLSAIFEIPIANINKILNGVSFQIGRIITESGLLENNEPVRIISIQTIGNDVLKITVSCQEQTVGLPETSNLTIKTVSLLDSGGSLPDIPRVPDATSLGLVGGKNSVTLNLSNIPDHEHNLTGDQGTQFYAINDSNTSPPDTGGFLAQGPSANSDAQYLPTSGKIDTTGLLSQPFNIMNPYLVINYIIYAGGTS